MEDENTSLSFCKDCQMMCSNLSSFKKHVRKRHPTKFQQLFPPKNNDSTPKHMCDDCGQSFNSNRSLSVHRRSAHPPVQGKKLNEEEKNTKRSILEDDSIGCSDCEIEFNDITTFKQHMRDHRDNKIVKVKKEINESLPSRGRRKSKSSLNKTVKTEEPSFVTSTPVSASVRKSTRVRKRISYANLVKSSSESEDEPLSSKINNKWNISVKNHVCKECHMEYEEKNDLTKHIRKHHPSKLAARSKLSKTRKRITLVQKKLSCVDCSTTYNNLSSLRKHVRKYHPEKWGELLHKLYKRPKNSGKSYNCKECQTVYGNIVGLRKHIRKYHSAKFNEMASKLYKKSAKTTEKTLSCPECQAKYKAMTSLRKHIQKKHPTKLSEVMSLMCKKENGDISCSECQMRYSNMSALRKHTRKHHPNKLLELAPKLYTFKRNLAKNILLKNQNCKKEGDISSLLGDELINMYKYMCNVCQSSYSNISNLRKHLRKFHPEKISDVAPLLKDYTNFKYLCDLCPKKFNCIRNFKYHQRKFHPEFAQPSKRTQKHIKVNKCPLCSFENTERKKLLEHFKIEHDIEVSMSPVDVHNLEDFSKWKDTFEKDTNARFVKEYHFSCMSHDVVSYICHRSGYYNPKGKGLRHMKAQGSSKINGYCPAAIKLKKIKDGTVKVTFCGTHIGHTTDVSHLHLTPAERQIIAEKIAMNMPFKSILESMRDSVSESDFKRIHLLSKKDLYNIKSSFHLNSTVTAKTVKPPAENVTFEIWIEDMKKSGDCIMFHKPQGQTMPEHQELKSEDFVLMIMNQAQRDKLRKFGHDTVCIDRSFDVNCHHFELVSLLVLNETEEGYPCAFLVSNRSDLEVMRLFFHFVKTNVGCINARVFMSDMVDYFYTAWMTIMSNVQLRFHCTWQIDHAWRKRVTLIKSKEKQEIVMKQLKVALQEKEISNFKIILESIVEELNAESYAWNFSNYLNENYLQREELWPSPDCTFTEIKYNPHFERMHKTLNHLFLNGKNAKHFGKALGDIMRFLREKLFDRTILINRGKINNKMKIAIFRHKLSLHSPTDTIVTTSDGWQIPSTTTSEIYTIKEMPVACRCEFICPECKCCIHRYLCSCLDSFVKWNMCKHIHLLCRYLNSVENVTKQSNNEIKADTMVKQNYTEEPTQQIVYVKHPQIEYIKHQPQQVEYIKPLQIEYVEQAQQVEYIKQNETDQVQFLKQAQQVDFSKQATQIENLQLHHIQVGNQVGHGDQVESTYIYCNETNQREMDAILAEVNICNLETVQVTQVTQIPTSCTIQIPTSCTVVPQVTQIGDNTFGQVVESKESLKLKFLKLLEEASSPSELEVVQKMLASITPTLEVIKGTTSNHQVLFPL